MDVIISKYEKPQTFFNVCTILVNEAGEYFFEFPVRSQHDVERVKMGPIDFENLGERIQAVMTSERHEFIQGILKWKLDHMALAKKNLEKSDT